MMDGPRPRLRLQRLIEAIVAALLLSGISIAVVGRSHGGSAASVVAADAVQDGPVVRRGLVVVDLRTGP